MFGLSSTALGIAAIAFTLAAVATYLARRGVDRLVATLNLVASEAAGSAAYIAALKTRAQQLTGALTILAYGIAAVTSVTLVLSDVDIAERRATLRAIGRWATTHGLNVILILVGGFVLVRLASFAIEHLQFTIGRRHSQTDHEWQRRAMTLGVILRSLMSVIIGFVAVLALLRELSIDILPILTGAGLAGVAIGFGAQNLIRDMISGFFLIVEDQIRIGDLIRINAVSGTVEQINLRTIVVRDHEGAVHVFPNGTVTALANLSKQFAYAVVDVKIPYDENPEKVSETVRQIGAQMESDREWAPLILAPIETSGVESLDGGAATIRMRFKTEALNQGKVASELRRRLMTTLVHKGIRLFTGIPTVVQSQPKP